MITLVTLRGRQSHTAHKASSCTLFYLISQEFHEVMCDKSIHCTD
jgi:hypothetical protein